MPVTASTLCRCASCARWQSVDSRDVETARCGNCGGLLHAVDMRAHERSLPRARPDPAELARLEQQKALADKETKK